MHTNAGHNEKELLLKVADGDEAAFRVLYDQYHQLLGSYIYRLTRSMSETEEIVHDVFLKLWITRESLGAIDNFKAYLYVVSKNHALNAINKRMTEISKNRQWQKEQSSISRTGVEEEEIFYTLIDKAIFNLPPQQKKAFELSRYERLTYVEIAQKMGISRETVKTYLQLATASITKYINEHREEALMFVFLLAH